MTVVDQDLLGATGPAPSGNDLCVPAIEDHPALDEGTIGYSDTTSVGGLARILYQRICGRA
jgi:hypothetical protein